MSTTESSDMNELWKEANKKLEAQMIVNEKLLRNMGSASTSFEKLLTLAILGRNLALVYSFISVVYAIRVFDSFAYSMPALLGGLAMLWSFFSHWSLKRVNFATLSVMELQEAICLFRIHADNLKRYDLSIVIFWVVTLAPAWLLSKANLAVYEKQEYMLIFFFFAAVLAVLAYMATRVMYGSANKKLEDAEQLLREINEFRHSG
jgi:hypothetical protein